LFSPGHLTSSDSDLGQWISFAWESPGLWLDLPSRRLAVFFAVRHGRDGGLWRPFQTLNLSTGAMLPAPSLPEDEKV